MRESRTYGSGRGARGNSRPYRESSWPAVSLAAIMAVYPLAFGVEVGNRIVANAAQADGPNNAVRDSTVPPARDPRIAVEEEYQIALERGTAEALQLFIERHPDSPLAEKARAELKRLSR